MKFAPFVLVSATVLLGGCANMNSIYRTLDLGTPGPNGVSLDVKQRVVLANTRKIPAASGTGVEPVNITCAEPSPDALSAYSSALAANFPLSPGSPSAGAGGVNGALSTGEASGSIGLRTQSIQLLRDGLFSNCLSFMNGAVSGQQHYELQRRSQNFTLGLLAIEQLTGVVKADQLALNTSASSATGSDNTERETENLQQAKEKQNEIQTLLQKANLAVTEAEKKFADQQKKLADARKALGALKPEDPLRKDAQELVDAELTKTEEARSELDNLRIDSEFQKRAALNAAASVTAANEALLAAQKRVRASTSGSAAFSRAAGPLPAVTEKVAEAVVKIVNAVLEQSGRGEDCSGLIVAVLRMPANAEIPDIVNDLLKASCTRKDREFVADALKLPQVKRELLLK